MLLPELPLDAAGSEHSRITPASSALRRVLLVQARARSRPTSFLMSSFLGVPGARLGRDFPAQHQHRSLTSSPHRACG